MPPIDVDNVHFSMNIYFVHGVFSELFVIRSLLYCCRMESTPNLRVEAGELVLRPSKQAATVEKVHLSQVAKGCPLSQSTLRLCWGRPWSGSSKVEGIPLMTCWWQVKVPSSLVNTGGKPSNGCLKMTLATPSWSCLDISGSVRLAGWTEVPSWLTRMPFSSMPAHLRWLQKPSKCAGRERAPYLAVRVTVCWALGSTRRAPTRRSMRRRTGRGKGNMCFCLLVNCIAVLFLFYSYHVNYCVSYVAMWSSSDTRAPVKAARWTCWKNTSCRGTGKAEKSHPRHLLHHSLLSGTLHVRLFLLPPKAPIPSQPQHTVSF